MLQMGHGAREGRDEGEQLFAPLFPAALGKGETAPQMKSVRRKLSCAHFSLFTLGPLDPKSVHLSLSKIQQQMTGLPTDDRRAWRRRPF